MQCRLKRGELAESKVEEADLYLIKLNKSLSAKSQRLFLGNEMLAFQEQIKNAKILKDKFVRELSSLSSIESSRRNVFLQKEADFKSLDRYKERKAGEHLAYELKKERKRAGGYYQFAFCFQSSSSLDYHENITHLNRLSGYHTLCFQCSCDAAFEL